MNNETPNQTNAVQPQPLQSDWLAEASVGDAMPPPRKRRVVIALIAVVIVAIIAGAVYILWPKSCFVVDDYQPLVAMAQDFEDGYGADLSDVEAGQVLFSQSVYFTEGTADIDDEMTNDLDDFYKQLAAYYVNHQGSAPVSIAISGEYIAGTSSDETKLRMQKIKAGLVDAGLPESTLRVVDPSAIVVDEDSENDDDIVDGLPVTVTITPISRCDSK